MKIPLVNLKRMHQPLRQQLDAVIQDIVEDGHFINGPQIQTFEKNYSQYIQVAHTIGVSSGTDALFLALKVIGLQPGEIVITVPHTFIATTEAISMAGGQIRFIDVHEKTANMDPQQLVQFLSGAERSVREKIKAIIFVDLYGNPAGLDEVYEIAQKYNLTLISDAAQAHGALINQKPITDYAHLTTYSFFPGKNLGAFGDAGAICTNHEEYASSLKMLRNHGRLEKYTHQIEAYNCRLDTLQAAILDVKLSSLSAWNQNRIKSAQLYNHELSGKGFILPAVEGYYQSVFHLYVMQVRNRQEIMSRLAQANIEAGIHYPIPLHLQPAYEHLGYKVGDFPVSEKLSQSIVSLPIDGTITEEEIKYIAQTIN